MMYLHGQLGDASFARSRCLYQLTINGKINFGGYEKGKIYGLLSCKSGKRMLVPNRVFFRDEKEALSFGYRPCGNCLPGKYKTWKALHG